MTKKHYKRFACEIRKLVEWHRDSAPLARKTIGQMMIAMADVFAEDNRNFDRGKFYEACLEKDWRQK